VGKTDNEKKTALENLSGKRKKTPTYLGRD